MKTKPSIFGRTLALLGTISLTLMPFNGFAEACRGHLKYASDPNSCSGCDAKAMAIWWVSEPDINLHFDDTPLGYQPSRGLRVDFNLSYRQRTLAPENAAIFGTGTNWTPSCRAFLKDATGVQSGLFRLYRGGAGEADDYLDYHLGQPQFYDGSVLTTPDSGLTYQIEYRDGAKDIFAKTFVTGSSETLFFLTARLAPAGHTLTYNYDSNPNIVRLLSLTDPDNRNTTFHYENAGFTNQITKVVDPFNRTNYIQYDAAGYVTNIIDVAGLTSRFVYDAGPRRSWITNLITAYGTTVFKHDGVNADTTNFYDSGNKVNRSLQVTLPNGGNHLYLYRQDASAILAATSTSVPNTSPFTNTFANGALDQRNSFHWEPIQFIALSTNFLFSGSVTNLTTADYILAARAHWLKDLTTHNVTRVPAARWLPSANGTVAGQMTWLDYAVKETDNNYIGASIALPYIKARVLPDGNTSYERVAHDNRNITNKIATYNAPDSGSGPLEVGGSPAQLTNRFEMVNDVDLAKHIGPESTQVVSNHFNAYHQPLISYNALNEPTYYTYNANQQITSIRTPAGLTTTNIYFTFGTDAGRLDKTIELEIQRTNSYTYYANGLVWSHTDERGLTTYNYWDNLQRLTGVWYPDGTTTSNIYTALDITATKDRLGNWSYAAYNSIRQRVAETNANGVVTRYGLCECGALQSVTNAWNTPIQTVTSYGYDNQGNRIYTYLPDATITNWFDSLKRLVMTGDAWGYEWRTYNNQGLLGSISNSFGAKKITIYDIEERPLYVLDANGVVLTNSYDALGRLASRVYPDGGVEHFGYSARGLAAHTNQLGQATYYGYDVARRKISETNANNEVLFYTNNAAGDLLTLVDGKSQVTRWNYDEYGRVTNKLDQLGTEIFRYAYDSKSRLTNRWSAQKGNTGYGYDLAGNLTNINYAVSPDITLQYDPLNRVTNMVDAVGTTKYGYATGGQMWTEDGPFASDTVTNSYNNRLRVGMDLQQPTGVLTNAFGYDSAKRLTGVISPAGSFNYLLPSTRPSPLVTRLDLPNTSYITNSYDGNARLLSTTLKNSSHTTLNSHTYQLNAGNQRTQQAFNSGSTYNYAYDAIGQLKIADSGTASEDRGYAYDAAWNLNYRTNNATLNTFTVDGLNQLANSTPGGVSVYDANGNLVSSGSTALEYSYDDENRLSIVQSNTVYYSTNYPLWQTLYAYDGKGRLKVRVERQNAVVPDPGGGEESLVFGEESLVESGGGVTWITNSVARYLYDGWRVIQERDEINTPTVSYTRGTDLGGSLEGAGGIGGLLGRSYGYSSGNWVLHNYYHADGNGNVTYLVSTSQTLAASYRYDPYGNVISSSGGAASANTYRFSSKMVELKTSLYYYGYRWYAPNLQRWVNRDPLGETGFEVLRQGHRSATRGGHNRFRFVANNPLVRVDPFGLEEQAWPKNGTVCNGCKEDVQILVEGVYYNLPPGKCTCDSSVLWMDVDGVWVKGTFYKVAPPGDFDTCEDEKPKYQCDATDRGAPSDTPPSKDGLTQYSESLCNVGIPVE